MAQVKNPTSDSVLVCLNHPHGIRFDLAGRKILVRGSGEELKGREMGVIPKGAFGMTEMALSDWEEIKRLYGEMEIFRSGLIFASADAKSARAEAAEKKETRHGREPASPVSSATVPAEKE